MARVTVEGCLEKLESRFELVMASTKRARQLHQGLKAMVPWENDKAPVVALREIEEGMIDPNKVDDLARDYEKELQAAEAGVSDSFMAGTVSSLQHSHSQSSTSLSSLSSLSSSSLSETTSSRLHTLSSTPSLFEQVASQPGPVKIVNQRPVAADQHDDIVRKQAKSIEKEIMSLSEAIAKKEAEDKAKQAASQAKSHDDDQQEDNQF